MAQFNKGPTYGLSAEVKSKVGEEGVMTFPSVSPCAFFMAKMWLGNHFIYGKYQGQITRWRFNIYQWRQAVIIYVVIHLLLVVVVAVIGMVVIVVVGLVWYKDTVIFACVIS